MTMERDLFNFLNVSKQQSFPLKCVCVQIGDRTHFDTLRASDFRERRNQQRRKRGEKWVRSPKVKGYLTL